MNDRPLQLPWGQLLCIEDIPWSALEAFAEAATTEPDLIDELFGVYEASVKAIFEGACCAHLCVPAIFALAAPGLDDRPRSQIGDFLLARLIEAGEEDDELMMEVLTAACGAMGPVILPSVLDALAGETASSKTWSRLWGLTRLAVGMGPGALGDRVAEVCADLLARVERDEVEYELGVEAACTLALMRRDEHAELLRRLARKSQWTLVHADYDAARRVLEERLESPFPEELWGLSVREWLEPRWKRVRSWLVVRSGATNRETSRAVCSADVPATRIPIVEVSPRGENAQAARCR